MHLCDWPVAGAIDSEIQAEMARTRQVIAEALALRMRRAENEEQIKIRQPLASLAGQIHIAGRLAKNGHEGGHG